MTMDNQPIDSSQIFESSRSGIGCFTEQLEQYRERMRRLVDARLDPRVRGRVDASDIIQDTNIEAFSRLEEYRNDQSVPFYVWLRFLLLQKVSQAHRTHLGTHARNAAREQANQNRQDVSNASVILAAQLVGTLTTASKVAEQAESRARLQDAIEKLAKPDREILTLRHYEQLSLVEVAAVLGIGKKAAGSRYLRAIKRLERIMTTDKLDSTS